jgi:hypothetical protein
MIKQQKRAQAKGMYLHLMFQREHRCLAFIRTSLGLGYSHLYPHLKFKRECVVHVLSVRLENETGKMALLQTKPLRTVGKLD